MVCKGPAPFHYKSQCPELKVLMDKGLCKIDPISRRIIFPDGSEVPQHPQGIKQAVLDATQATATAAAVEIVGWKPPQVSNGPRQFVASAGEAAEMEGYQAEKCPHGTDSENPRSKKRTVPVVEIPVRNKGKGKEADRRHQPVGDTEMGDEEMPPPPPRVHRKDGEKENRPEEAVVRKTPASRPWSKVIEQYGDEVEGIPRTILDSRISLSVGSILTMSKDMVKTLTDEFRVKRVPVPTTTWKARAAQAEEENQKEANSALVLRHNPTYCGPVGRLVVNIQGVELEALFNTGSEINLCPKRIYAKTGLALQESNLFLRDANAKTTRLLGYLENVEMKCSRLRTRQHLHVQSDATYDLLLGMPFIRAVSARTWFDGEGSLWVKMSDCEGEEVTVCLTRADDPKHRAQPPPPRRHKYPIIRNKDSDTESEAYASNATALEFEDERLASDEAVRRLTEKLNKTLGPVDRSPSPAATIEEVDDTEGDNDSDDEGGVEDGKTEAETEDDGSQDEAQESEDSPEGEPSLTYLAMPAAAEQPEPAHYGNAGLLEVAAALATHWHMEGADGFEPGRKLTNSKIKDEDASYVTIAEGPTRKVWEYKLGPDSARSFLRLADAMEDTGEWGITSSPRLPDLAAEPQSVLYKKTWNVASRETGKWRGLCELMTDTRGWEFVVREDHSVVVEVLNHRTQEAWLYKLTPEQASSFEAIGKDMAKLGEWRETKHPKRSSLSFYKREHDVQSWNVDDSAIEGWKEMCDFLVKEGGWILLGKIAVSTAPPSLDYFDYSRYSSNESGWGTASDEEPATVMANPVRLDYDGGGEEGNIGKKGGEEQPVLLLVGIGSLTAYLDDLWANGGWTGKNKDDDRKAREKALDGIKGRFGEWLRAECAKPDLEPDWESFRRLALGGIYAFTEAGLAI
ncbi:hypothetical protein JCM6882_004089 [Rhodosporidiobolus microsporus]